MHAACLRQQLLEQLGYITTTTPSYASSSSSVSINSSSKHHSPIAQRGGSRRHGAEADGSESDAGANPPQSSSQRCRQRHMNAGSKSSHGSGAQQHHGSLWLSSAPLTHMLDVHAHGPGLDDASTHHVHAHVGIHHQHAGLAGASSSISGSDSHTNSVSQQNRDQCKQRSENARPLVGSYGFDTDTPALPLSPLPQLPAMLLHGVASDVWWQLSVSSQHAAAQAHDHLTRDLKVHASI